MDGYRPYALTSRLHNNDAMLGVKTCRAARTCFAGRAHWRSPSQSVCAPGPARRWGMQGFALWVHAWRWCTWRASFDPQHHGGALLWRHMHMVYWQFWIGSVSCVVYDVPFLWLLPRELRWCTMSAGLILNPVTGVIINCKALWVVFYTTKALYKNQLLSLLFLWLLVQHFLQFHHILFLSDTSSLSFFFLCA